MSNWRLYTADAALYRYSSTSASHNSAGAPFLVALNPQSVWTPGGTAISPRVGVDLGVSTDLIGVGIAGHNVGGLDINVYKGNTLLGMDTLIATKTLPGTPSPTAKSPDAIVTFGSESIRYLTVRINAGLSGTDYIGAIAALTEAGLIEFESKSSALFGPQSGMPGYSEIETGGKVRIRQVTGSVQRVFQLTFPRASTADGDTGAKVLEEFDRTNGFANGVWLTDYTFGSPTAGIGRAYYCTLTPGTDLLFPSGPIAQEVAFSMSLQELAKPL